MDRIGRRRVLATGVGLAALGLPGCSTPGEDDPSERGPLSVADLAFSDEEPTGHGEYAEVPDATFTRGETLWMYVELDGLAARPLDDGVEIDLTQEFTLEHGEQGVVSDDSRTYSRQLQRNQLERFYAKSELPLQSETLTGEYTVTVEYTDNVSETSDSATATFTVEE